MNFNESEKVVFKGENGKYSIGVSNKKQDGTYENAYFPIQFNKGVELENKTKIKIKSSWLSFYKWEHEDKKGTTFFIRCNDFEKIGEEPTKGSQLSSPYSDFGKIVEEDESELPF